MESASLLEAFRLVHWSKVSPAAARQIPFSTIDNCPDRDFSLDFVASDLDGTLLFSRDPFPYFMLLAFEAGGLLRAIVLLLLSPIVWVMQQLRLEDWSMKFLIFVSCAGLKRSVVETVSRGVLAKFYLEGMHPRAFNILTSCKRRVVVTGTPRLMAEPFLRDFLGVEAVLGTELEMSSGGYCTGLVSSPGVLHAESKARALKKYCGDDLPDIGLGDDQTDFLFMGLCKEAYRVPASAKVEPVPKSQYPKPLIFHDGRFAQRPTRVTALLYLIYSPLGLPLALVRLVLSITVPYSISKDIAPWVGVTLNDIPFTPPSVNSQTDSFVDREQSKSLEPGAQGENGQSEIKDSDYETQNPDVSVERGKSKGVLFVCTHRTLLDPIIVSMLVRKKVTALTYSISRFTEFLSPIKTFPLSRNRAQDAATMIKLLEEGDLFICPEGTTCREPFLLRFSALFAECADRIVPVAVKQRYSMFHGTSVRGWKGLDPVYFLMNPFPRYDVTFLPELPVEWTCRGGKTSLEVANHVQRLTADYLGFQCTNYTRKDKYRALAGHDGVVRNTDRRSLSVVHPENGR